VYSLNVPVPGDIARLAADVARDLPGASARSRGEHTLVVKRLGGGSYGRLEARVRELLAGQPPFGIRVAAVEYFADAPTGSSPVVYLAVESPELVALHRRLADAFDPVGGIEGEAYVPHVTVARGGSLAAAKRAAGPVDPLSWTVSELCLWDGTRAEPVSRVSLPV